MFLLHSFTVLVTLLAPYTSVVAVTVWLCNKMQTVQHKDPVTILAEACRHVRVVRRSGTASGRHSGNCTLSGTRSHTNLPDGL